MTDYKYVYDNITTDELTSLSQKVLPVGKNGTCVYELTNLDAHLRNRYSYTFDLSKYKARTIKGLYPLKTLNLLYSWAYYGFVKPSWGEALSHLTYLKFDEPVAAIELLTNNASIYSGEPVAGDTNYHIIPTVFYGKVSPDEDKNFISRFVRLLF